MQRRTTRRKMSSRSDDAADRPLSPLIFTDGVMAFISVRVSQIRLDDPIQLAWMVKQMER
jgi:hypothetical protein